MESALIQMQILQVHCDYVAPGGETPVLLAEEGLCRSCGHDVKQVHASNAEVIRRGTALTVNVLISSAWNRPTHQHVRRICRESHPDIVHVHNFWWALSPSVFAAAKAEGVPTVMTLHNYRLICPGSLLMRDGRSCEVCVGRTPWRGVPRACYRDSAAQTALVARAIDSNRRRGTWTRDVDAFVALTEFSRRRFIQGGLPAWKIHVKPNFLLEDPGEASGRGEGAVFVGRLSPEKGVHVLVDAWKRVTGTRLAIVGDGPERGVLERLGSGAPGLAFTGELAHDEALTSIKRAALLVLPSVCYETFGRTIIEAFACGRPVVASRLGAMAEIVDDGRTGLLFEPGNARDLAEKIRFMLDNPAECERMGREARAEFERKYTAEANYPQLMAIYERAIENARGGRRRRRASAGDTPAVGGDGPPRVNVAGASVSRVSYASAARTIAAWAERQESRYVCITSAHGIVTARGERDFRKTLNSADMVTPDGVPVVWTMRLAGAHRQRRVYGPTLMAHVCRMCAERGLPIFLYGATAETLARLGVGLTRRFPQLKIAGSHAPPFRPLTEDEDRETVERVNASGARVVFVGLSTPKQERWMHAHRGRVQAVMIGVGAAFDFHAGTLRQAPPWMQRAGLEWLFRLMVEPGRLWRRYLKIVPTFGAVALTQIIRDPRPKPAPRGKGPSSLPGPDPARASAQA
jgi:exopolysaccharide biosynthesis WecB/TagA/CpsF family protein